MPTRRPIPFVLAALTLLALPRFAAAEEAIYEVKATEVKSKVGAKGTTSLTIVGKNGWHVNEEAPVSVKLTPAAGISVDKQKLTRKDLAEKSPDKARFDVGFTASAAGKQSIAAEARFVMCQASACKPVTEKLVLAIDVAAK